MGTIVMVLWWSGEPISWSWLKSISSAVAVTLGVMTAFDKWLWRLPFLQGWFVKRPHLSGEWRGTIQSEWVDPETKRRPMPISVAITVGQTYSSIYVRLRTEESHGDLVTSSLKQEDDGRFWLYGIYRNESEPAVRRRSPVHLGTFQLEIEGPPNAPEKLRGRYWTERGTQGMITAKRPDKEIQQATKS